MYTFFSHMTVFFFHFSAQVQGRDGTRKLTSPHQQAQCHHIIGCTMYIIKSADLSYIHITQ